LIIVLHDLEIGKFRTIKTEDFIIRTTGYNLNKNTSPNIKENTDDLLCSVFENDEVINFWKRSTALSMFGKSYE